MKANEECSLGNGYFFYGVINASSRECSCCTYAKDVIAESAMTANALYTVYRNTPEPVVPAAVLDPNVVTDNFKLSFKYRECAVQGRNFGPIKVPEACAAVARKAGCDAFMFSHEYPQWGCRCCDKADGGPLHKLWNVFTVDVDYTRAKGQYYEAKAKFDAVTEIIEQGHEQLLNEEIEVYEPAMEGDKQLQIQAAIAKFTHYRPTLKTSTAGSTSSGNNSADAWGGEAAGWDISGGSSGSSSGSTSAWGSGEASGSSSGSGSTSGWGEAEASGSGSGSSSSAWGSSGEASGSTSGSGDSASGSADANASGSSSGADSGNSGSSGSGGWGAETSGSSGSGWGAGGDSSASGEASGSSGSSGESSSSGAAAVSSGSGGSAAASSGGSDSSASGSSSGSSGTANVQAGNSAAANIEIAQPIEIAVVEPATEVDGETVTPPPMSGWTPDIQEIAEADEATLAVFLNLK